MILEVKVLPNASQNEIVRWEEEGRLVIKVQGVPEKGKVNANLIAFLAKKLKIAKSQITLISGNTSRLKRLHLEGVSLETVQKLLPP